MIRTGLACATALLMLAVSGCAGGTSASPTATTVTTTADPVSQCSTLLRYWAQQGLQGGKDAGWDYQEMGLSSEQYDALLALLAQARKQPSGQATPGWLLKQATAACTRLVASATPTTSAVGWP